RVVTGGDPEAVTMLNSLAKYPRKPRLADFTPLGPWLDPLRPKSQRGHKVAAFDELLYRLVDARRDAAYAGPRDLIWPLNHLPDRKTGESLPRTDVRDEAASMIAGGGPPPARALPGVCTCLPGHPEVGAGLKAS